MQSTDEFKPSIVPTESGRCFSRERTLFVYEKNTAFITSAAFCSQSSDDSRVSVCGSAGVRVQWDGRGRRRAINGRTASSGGRLAIGGPPPGPRGAHPPGGAAGPGGGRSQSGGRECPPLPFLEIYICRRIIGRYTSACRGVLPPGRAAGLGVGGGVRHKAIS